jgi:Protein of unknown function (DUF1579)
MKKSICLFGLLAIILISGKLFAQTPEEMKAFMEYMTPGPMQQMLAKSVGTWTGDISMWTKEGVPPTTSTLESVNDTILGGRYLQTKHTGQMWGMPFFGIGTTGYDNAKKIFVNTWIDNMGTGIIYMEGTWDAATKTIKFKGKSTDPMTGKDTPTREVLTFTDDNHFTLEMYFTEKMKEFKAMEIKYTKK